MKGDARRSWAPAKLRTAVVPAPVIKFASDVAFTSERSENGHSLMIASCGGDFSIHNTPMPGWTQCKPVDPGWLYIIQNDDLFKIGKTTNPQRRLREASTWLPDGKVVGMKPFYHLHRYERVLLCGLANCWHKGEWHRFIDHDLSVQLTSDFAAFDDHDRNRNTVDFNYWIGGSGMGEVIMEQNYRRVSLRRWQKLAAHR